MTGTFTPTNSSNTLWFDDNMNDCLTSHIEEIEDDVAALETGKANVSHTHSFYADIDHEHSEYALTTHTHSGYAATNHTHTDYATSTHNHSEYALATDVDALENKVGDSTVASQISTAIATKADSNHTHTEYAVVDHTHSGYASSTHIHSYNDLEDKPTIPSAYTHPSYTEKSSGLYKVTVDSTGHVSAATAVTKADITALGIPESDTDTTYSVATTSVEGLMSASDKAKLDGIASGATSITVDNALSSSSTNPVQNKVINEAITDLNALVGDTAVSTQIANAISTKSDASHTHNYLKTTNDIKVEWLTQASADGTVQQYFLRPIKSDDSDGKYFIGGEINYWDFAYIKRLIHNGGIEFGSPLLLDVKLDLSEGGTGSNVLASAPNNAIVRKGADVDYLTYTTTANGAYYATGENARAQFGTLPIAQGGTGGTTAAAARENIGAASSSHTHTRLTTGGAYLNLNKSTYNGADAYYLRGLSSTDTSVGVPTCIGSSTYPMKHVYTDALNVYQNRIVCLPSYENTSTYAPNVYVGTTGIFSRSTNTSSKTIKHDIKNLEDENIQAENLYDVNIYQFKYNDGIITDENDVRYKKDLPGFIIEDLIEKYPIAVDKPTDEVKDWSWNAQYLIPPMLKLIQDQHKEIEKLKIKIERLESK